MNISGSIRSAPREIRVFITIFVISLNVGFFTGFNFVRTTTSLSSAGIERNYLGNEEDENAEVMYFKKSEKEVLTLIHNHVLSLSVIFFLLGGLLFFSNMNNSLKSILMFEPFVSLILTFGGIYLLWHGMTWVKYIIMISGGAMIISVVWSSIYLIKECLIPSKMTSN